VEFCAILTGFRPTLSAAKIMKLSERISKRAEFAHAKHGADLRARNKIAQDGLPRITKSLILTLHCLASI